MFPRYKLVVRHDNDIVFEKYFPTINSVIKVSTGFDFDSDIYISIVDELMDSIFPHAYVKRLVKEFVYEC